MKIGLQAIAIMPSDKACQTSWLIVPLLNGSAAPSHGADWLPGKLNRHPTTRRTAMSKDQINTEPCGTVIEVENREHMERLILGDSLAFGGDMHEYFARESFLDTVEELLKQGDRKLVKF